MLIGQMSIFYPRSAIQPLKNSAGLLESDCLLCGAMRGGEICAACDADLERVADGWPQGARAWAFDAVRTVFSYRFPLERLVHRFKYAGDLAVGQWLALRLAEHVCDEPGPDVIVVPPSARARLRERGFNPAAEIAKVVARTCAVSLDCSLVLRTREQAPQAGLTRRERLANVRGAFACGSSLRGMDVAIVDDVMTTGATADAIARALKAAGAARVRVWAVARTPQPGL